VTLQSVTPDIAEALGLNVPRGSIVAGIDPGGPAAAAGVQEGDVIMSIGSLTPRDSRALWRTIAKAPLDKAVDLTVWRDGHIRTVDPVVREWPAEMGAPPVEDGPTRAAGARGFDPGFQLASLTPALRNRLGIDGPRHGVVVMSVAADGPAADRGIAAGDVILRAGVTAVARPEDIEAAIAAERRQNASYLLLLVWTSGTGQRFITLPLYPEG
jgi:serine protease Do